ncbi:hypothetical protein BaRGS_00017711 [Batillaria attramentaria]|uniref:Major facilitator superfamily (MFS) profile domain-containing protein n=1 Tax=Batillaria attramentaria TaxID=370345 RepID=A0ABD0KV35_9CAEN
MSEADRHSVDIKHYHQHQKKTKPPVRVFFIRTNVYKVGVMMVLIAAGVLISACVNPYWTKFERSGPHLGRHVGITLYEGLWVYCYSVDDRAPGSDSDRFCSMFDFDLTVWFHAVRTLVSLCVLCLLVGCAYAIIVNCCKMVPGHRSRFLEIITAIGGVLGMAGVILYVLKRRDHEISDEEDFMIGGPFSSASRYYPYKFWGNDDFDWGVYKAGFSGALAILSAVTICVGNKVIQPRGRTVSEKSDGGDAGSVRYCTCHPDNGDSHPPSQPPSRRGSPSHRNGKTKSPESSHPVKSPPTPSPSTSGKSGGSSQPEAADKGKGALSLQAAADQTTAVSSTPSTSGKSGSLAQRRSSRKRTVSLSVQIPDEAEASSSTSALPALRGSSRHRSKGSLSAQSPDEPELSPAPSTSGAGGETHSRRPSNASRGSPRRSSDKRKGSYRRHSEKTNGSPRLRSGSTSRSTSGRTLPSRSPYAVSEDSLSPHSAGKPMSLLSSIFAPRRVSAGRNERRFGTGRNVGFAPLRTTGKNRDSLTLKIAHKNGPCSPLTKSRDSPRTHTGKSSSSEPDAPDRSGSTGVRKTFGEKDSLSQTSVDSPSLGKSDPSSPQAIIHKTGTSTSPQTVSQNVDSLSITARASGRSPSPKTAGKTGGSPSPQTPGKIGGSPATIGIARGPLARSAGGGSLAQNAGGKSGGSYSQATGGSSASGNTEGSPQQTAGAAGGSVTRDNTEGSSPQDDDDEDDSAESSSKRLTYPPPLTVTVVIRPSISVEYALAPVYLAEILPRRHVGPSLLINTLIVLVAVAVVGIVGFDDLFATPSLWPVIVGSHGVFAVLQLLIVCVAVPSPYFLLLKQKETEAFRALQLLRGGSHDVQSELHEMKEAVKASKKEKEVTFYSVQVLQAVGLSERISRYVATGVMSISILATVLALVFLHRLKRRHMMLVGLGGLFFSGGILSVSLIFGEDIFWLQIVGVVCIPLMAGSHAFGPGEVPWLLIPELFDSSSRGAASSVCVMVLWLALFVIGYAYPPMQEAIGPYSILPFVGLSAFFFVVFLVLQPETLGKEVSDVEIPVDEPQNEQAVTRL